jgi:hypothetical protein
MDPALERLLAEGDPEDEVALILRLTGPGEEPPGVRVVASFGRIVTCRVRLGLVRQVYASPKVRSAKAPRIYGMDVEEPGTEPLSESIVDGDERRPGPECGTGRGVVAGFIDWGCDFAHPDFREPDGNTRLLALWDQRPGPDPTRPNRYGYGVIHDSAAINAALATGNPYAALGYHPADSDIGIGTHGAHTMSIAVGNGRGHGPVGVAPEASPVFVQLSTWGPQGPNRLGDSVALLEAVDFIVSVAGDRPWVINCSLGRHCGPHNGLTLVEQALDAVLLDHPAGAGIHSTGNYFARKVHASGRLRPGEERVVSFTMTPVTALPHELDLWYAGADRLRLVLLPPDGADPIHVAYDGSAVLRRDGRTVVRADHRTRDPNGGENELLVTFYPGAPVGSWRLRLLGEDVVDGRFHAWLERTTGAQQPTFDDDDVVVTTTTGTICNGQRTIAVGAYDAHTDGRPLGRFSSCGPTADNRVKPDVLAPGVSVLAARSAPRTGTAPMLTRMSGTSMAAPHVTGAVALMLAAAPRPLHITETRRLLLEAAQPVPSGLDRADRVGSGYLDIDAAVAAARAADSGEEERIMSTAVAEDSAIGTVATGTATIPISPVPFPEPFSGDLDVALRYALGTGMSAAVVRGSPRGGPVELFRWFPPAAATSPLALSVRSTVDIAALVLGGTVYLTDPAEPGGGRWVQVPGLRSFYLLPQDVRQSHRQRWIRALRMPGAASVPTPTLRLLVAQQAATAVPVHDINDAARHFLGAATNGLTVPFVSVPLREPDCYLAAISQREGRVDAINAYDLGAGISLGPIQVNVQRGALFRLLQTLATGDPDLFARELGGPLGWSMRPDAGHTDLVVTRPGVPDIVLHGRAQDQRDIIGYLQSGTPGQDGFADIDQAWRRTLALRFRNLVVWPAVQQIVLDVTNWWLEPGLRRIEAAGIPALDPRAPDRSVFILKTLLLSAFVRYSGCLQPILAGLAQWATPAEKLAHWREVVAGAQSPCPRLHARLEQQERDAAAVFAQLQALLAAGTGEAAPEAEHDEWTECGEFAIAAGSRPELVELAESAVGAGTGSAFLAEVLNGHGDRVPSPARLFDAYLAGRPVPRLEVVAAPRTVLAVVPQAGDLLVRRGEAGYGHVAVIATPGVWTRDHLRAVEAPRPGRYVHVVEAGPRPHLAGAGFGRLLTDDAGRLPADTLLLRLPATETEEGTPSLSPSALHWRGASSQQLEFMRAVYESHVARSARRRSIVTDVPPGQLGEIEDGKLARTEAAAGCRELLASARTEASTDPAARGVTRIQVTSAYRPASRQFAAWQSNFPRYLAETAEHRAQLDGGEYGPAAVTYLAGYIGRRLGAPGYSLHNDGRAIDFATVEDGHRYSADTSPASVSGWKRTWFFAWLSSNAARWHFFQNTRIDEPWHWEYRGTGGAATEAAAEAGMVTSGRLEIADVPLLAHHRGTEPSLVLRWNRMADPVRVDVVVHLHGYSRRGAAMQLVRDIEPISGLDLGGLSAPTLAVLPRGNFFGGRSGAGYDFPALVAPSGLTELIELALGRFAQETGVTVERGSLIVTAHSGGGAALRRMLRHNDPDRIHIFDGLYGDPEPFAAWARDHIRRGAGALRVMFTGPSGTERNSLALHRAISSALSTLDDRERLADRFRVERTGVNHHRIPQRYGAILLSDSATDLPEVLALNG